MTTGINIEEDDEELYQEAGGYCMITSIV